MFHMKHRARAGLDGVWMAVSPLQSASAPKVPVHFTFRNAALYGSLPVPTGYDDKLLRAIDATDPGAVPGGSTIWAEQRDQHA